MALAQEGITEAPDLELGRSRLGRWWVAFRNWPVIPIIIIGALVACAIFAPLIANKDPYRGDLFYRNYPPFWYNEFYEANPDDPRFILGTGPQGRDVFSRVVYGARISMTVAAIVLTAGAVGGTVIGLVAGYFGGNVDEILMRFADLTFAVPFILVALVVVIVLGPSLTIIIVLLVAFSWAVFRASSARRSSRFARAGLRVHGKSRGRVPRIYSV